MSSRPFAEATQAEIDEEVSRLLRQAEQRAIGLLKDHRPELDALVELLLEKETVDGSDVYRLAGRPNRSATIPPMPPATMAPPRAAAADPPAAAQAANGPLAGAGRSHPGKN